MPPAFAIAAWLSSLAARFQRPLAAFSFCALVPLRASVTSGSMPPAFAIATWLSAFAARLASAAAAIPFCPFPPLLVSATSLSKSFNSTASLSFSCQGTEDGRAAASALPTVPPPASFVAPIRFDRRGARRCINGDALVRPAVANGKCEDG